MHIASHRDGHETLPAHEYVNAHIVPYMKKQGFALFSGALNVNLVVVRTPDRTAGQFDDWLFLFELDHNHKALIASAWRVTADPGDTALAEVKNPKGVASLVAPQQVRSGLEIGLHKGVYAALRQAAPFEVVRDKNRDKIHNAPRETLERGFFGINVHAADMNPFTEPTSYKPGRRVGKWSEGCVVFADGYDYATHFWPWILFAAEMWGPKFTLTVIEGPAPSWALEN